jgi:ribose 5-phosphate isomerase B
MNVLCLGAHVVGVELAVEIVTAFLNARFSNEERHCRRLKKLLAIEKQALSKTIGFS